MLIKCVNEYRVLSLMDSMKGQVQEVKARLEGYREMKSLRELTSL